MQSTVAASRIIVIDCVAEIARERLRHLVVSAICVMISSQRCVAGFRSALCVDIVCDDVEVVVVVVVVVQKIDVRREEKEAAVQTYIALQVSESGERSREGRLKVKLVM